jgi:hypothetical protein
MDNQNYFLTNLPQDVYSQIFTNFSGFEFLIFPQVGKSCANFVSKYIVKLFGQDRLRERGLEFVEECFWKAHCLAEKHESWCNRELSFLDKDRFPTYKKLYLASEPKHYISVMQKFDHQDLIARYKIQKVNKFSWTSPKTYHLIFSGNKTPLFETEQEIHLVLTQAKNIERIVVSTIGKERFNKIPLFRDQVMIFSDEINKYMNEYTKDLTYPPIVRGITCEDRKFIFTRSRIIQKKENELTGYYYTFLYSDKGTFIDYDESHYPNLGIVYGDALPRIKCLTVKIFQSFATTGTCNYDKKKRLECLFDWKKI